MSWRDRDYGRNRRPPDDRGGHAGGGHAGGGHGGPVDDDEDDGFGDEEDDDFYTPSARSGDRNAPDPSDLADGDEPAFVKCPNCKRLVADDAERCPRCGHYLIDDEIARSGRPAWVWVGIVLAIVVAALWALAP